MKQDLTRNTILVGLGIASKNVLIVQQKRVLENTVEFILPPSPLPHVIRSSQSQEKLHIGGGNRLQEE